MAYHFGCSRCIFYHEFIGVDWFLLDSHDASFLGVDDVMLDMILSCYIAISRCKLPEI
jgi:hypothetical protein